MSENGIRGVDLFKIAGESISGWIPSWKLGGQKPARQPFCSLMEERLLMYLEYHPQVVCYGRGDISPAFASTYNITTPLTTPFAINYLFDGNAHVYLPDAIGQLQDGSLLIAEAGMEQEKRRERNQAKAEAARKVASAQGGAYWIGTETTLLPKRHANLVFLHARRQPFPSFPELAEALQVVWPLGEAACVQEVVERLGERWGPSEKEAAVWKRCADAAACGHLLVDLANAQLTRLTPLICLSPDSLPILPDPLPSHLESSTHQEDSPPLDASVPEENEGKPDLLSTFDDSFLDEKQRERGSRAICVRWRRSEMEHLSVRQQQRLLWGARPWAACSNARSSLDKWPVFLVRPTIENGKSIPPFNKRFASCTVARPNCRSRPLTPHVELKQVALRLRQDTGEAFALPSYDQVRRYIQTLQQEPRVRKERGEERGARRERQSPLSFALSIPAPAQLAQVDEHTMELYVETPDGIPVASRIHAAVLVCVKTAAIMSAVIALGPLAEEDYMRLVKGMVEPKDRLVLKAGCQHDWPCYGKPATIFHDRGKIFTSERARQVLVDRLGIITEQAPPYCPSAKGTVESLFRWMTQCFERRLPNTCFGIHDAQKAAEGGGMTLEELECYFIRAIVDDYQQNWDGLRRQKRNILWEEAVRQTGVPQYLGAPDDLKLLLMKAHNRKLSSHAYRVHDRSRLSFQGNWYVSPGLLNRLAGREFEIYYDRRDVSVIYLFVDGSYVGEAYCPAFMGQRISEWEAKAMRKADTVKAKAAGAEVAAVRAQIQEDIETPKKQRGKALRRREKARQFDRQREEIHPSSVVEALESLAPTARESLQLAEATPDPEKAYSWEPLAIRYREKEGD